MKPIILTQRDMSAYGWSKKKGYGEEWLKLNHPETWSKYYKLSKRKKLSTLYKDKK